MITRLVKADEKSVAEAAELIRSGELVGFVLASPLRGLECSRADTSRLVLSVISDRSHSVNPPMRHLPPVNVPPSVAVNVPPSSLARYSVITCSEYSRIARVIVAVSPVSAVFAFATSAPAALKS